MPVEELNKNDSWRIFISPFHGASGDDLNSRPTVQERTRISQLGPILSNKNQRGL
jgi:hypothetical protein